MHIWHVNVRGPEETPWKGGVFHMILKFTEHYPRKPPELFLCTPLTHPCVQRKDLKITINHLTGSSEDEGKTEGEGAWYEGWQSAYTVESILIQLQAFLFEKKPEAMTPR